MHARTQANLAHRQRQYLYVVAVLFLLLPTIGMATARPGVCRREGESLLGTKPVVVRRTGPTPKKVRDVRPTYPTREVVSRATGHWVAEALIDQSGDIRRVWVLREVTFDPPWPEFNEAIATAVRQWKYEPLEVRGRPVAVCMTVRSIIH